MTIEQALSFFKQTLNQEVVASIRNAYGEFTKAPIDTGRMRDNTNLVGVQINLENMSIRTAFDTTEYAKYVRFPESPSNPNFKYGPRDFIRSALEQEVVVDARNKLLEIMLIKSLELEEKGLGFKNIKIKV